MPALRIAALVKQIPRFEELQLGDDGRLVRQGLDLEMNPYCRRAVAQAVALAAGHGGHVTVFTLGPPSADDVLREAIAWGLDRGVQTRGVLVTDPAFAGSDTLATARALAAALGREGPFDLVLVGRNSVDSDTGQVGPELAQLLDLPFATGVRHLALEAGVVDARCEHDDGWAQLRFTLPAALSVAERLVDPCKVDPEGRAAVPADRISTLAAADLGPGPFGEAGSPTRVGPVRLHAVDRARRQWPEASIEEQVRRAVAALVERGALDAAADDAADAGTVPAHDAGASAPPIVVVLEPDRTHLSREMLGSAATLGAAVHAPVVAMTLDLPEEHALGGWGADRVVHLVGENVEEDVAHALCEWARAEAPWAALAPSTAWGREVAARVAAALGAGLTGDAVDLEVHEGRLRAWKPAFGGQLVAAIDTASDLQMVTVRAGVLPTLAPRRHRAERIEVQLPHRGRVKVRARTRDDDLDVLADADVVLGVGRGIDPAEYPLLEPLRTLLGAELAATRKVTDQGWLPRSRQVGITGRSIAPRLFISLAAEGKFNHMVGVRAAASILAVNASAGALVFDTCDVGIVGDWHVAVPLLVDAIQAVLTPA